ncbi:tRNA pseudouridine(38-40) synthase TruA [Bremerella sp. T1]|uniref:tRNA pseudouridine(38-40) synthase TruA n=1 Tax=Bremerella sp. TYQ1 TaxID=3119568 RepID=UPI001CCE0EC8|nr:tRNA pseudouridine(38-40) synthase TruA [Bremerella volcania]UBM38031.1 tRNA pseudouridine(38-40) synthase TruA [Bremerella volcania]
MESSEHAAASSSGRCIKLTVAYDGTNYQGWQRQPTGPTIQAALEAAINSISQEAVHIVGSGRTDAGVHAWGQVASFHTQSKLPADVFRKALNATLPEDIVVRHACDAPINFRPINDAISKRYRYVLQPGRINDPFSLKHAWFVKRVLDVESMQFAAQTLIGEHDFAAFQATGSPRQSTIRTMLDASVTVHDADERAKIHIEVEATGFLYNMVRIIAGTLVEVGQGKRTVESVADAITSCDRLQAGMTAPAHGLYLLKVHYPPHE